MRVAIIGTGKIGTDLFERLNKNVVAFVGRRNVDRGELYHPNGIEYFKEHPNCCEVVFDCTDAHSAIENQRIFKEQGIFVIDMTPSNQGYMCVPFVNCNQLVNNQNISMITCGGQMSIPMIQFIKSNCKKISYVELITQISSSSAGMATRVNIDNYIQTTEYAIKNLLGIDDVKVILVINPGSVRMQSTLNMRVDSYAETEIDTFMSHIQSYIPEYQIAKRPSFISPGVLSVSMYISGNVAGNISIINSAAIQTLKKLDTLKSNESV
jgi:acetaldehyde dehydrogenase